MVPTLPLLLLPAWTVTLLLPPLPLLEEEEAAAALKALPCFRLFAALVVLRLIFVLALVEDVVVVIVVLPETLLPLQLLSFEMTLTRVGCDLC